MYEEFISWIEDNDYLYKNYCDMEVCLKKYLEQRMRGDREKAENICKNFGTVVGKCDEISYDEEGVPEAYVILHFLDRYHRFQLILLEMFRKGIFPIKKNIRIMDVGTGPGPSLYAVSDMIALFQKYEEEKQGKTAIASVSMDYVEQSQGFRDFLHHMTEWLMAYRDKIYVPFHHGTYYDAGQLDFTGRVERVNFIWENGRYTYRETYDEYTKKRFDLVIYSNFLTNMSVLERFALQLEKAAFFLRKEGVIVIVGGNPHDRKYAPVYEKIDDIILKQSRRSGRGGSSCNRIGNIEQMHYGNDIIDASIKKFYREELDILTKGDWEKNLEEEFRKQMSRFIEGEKETTWYYVLYSKQM